MDVDELYGLALDRFVAERNALARSLRAAGERQQADDVAALRKPSVAAWAVNQLVRTQRRALAELFAAGDELQQAQAEVLAGRGNAAALRTAAGRERSAVDALVQSAGGLLTTDGHELSGAVIERVAETLHAAAVDSDARTQSQDGRLAHELRHVGVTIGAAPAGPRAPTRRSRRSPKARSDARAAESRTRREAERAARAVELAEERREQVARTLREVDEQLARLRAEADAAARAHERARAELDRAEG